MTNADKFKNLFGIYATELWSMPEKDFLKWLNSEVMNCSEIPNNSGTISRQAAIDAPFKKFDMATGVTWIPLEYIEQLPSAEPKQRYTEEELSVFAHGISLSLLSKRSAQHWRYDEDTATEIKFLERLYEKVGADIRGKEV